MTVEVWRIYHVDPCQYTNPEPKPKFIIIACVDVRAWGFLINTNIDKWIKINPGRLACQAEILAEEHPCLDHDSWVDCTALFAFDEPELNQKRELVSPTAKQDILTAVANSKTLPIKLKKRILKR
jgi:hypothetical protein